LNMPFILCPQFGIVKRKPRRNGEGGGKGGKEETSCTYSDVTPNTLSTGFQIFAAAIGVSGKRGKGGRQKKKKKRKGRKKKEGKDRGHSIGVSLSFAV